MATNTNFGTRDRPTIPNNLNSRGHEEGGTLEHLVGTPGTATMHQRQYAYSQYQQSTPHRNNDDISYLLDPSKRAQHDVSPLSPYRPTPQYLNL
jgi:hypothetical protein